MELNISHKTKEDIVNLTRELAEKDPYMQKWISLAGIDSTDGVTSIDYEERSAAFEGFNKALVERVKNAESTMYSIWQIANLIKGGEHIKGVMNNYRKEYPTALVEQLKN